MIAKTSKMRFANSIMNAQGKGRKDRLLPLGERASAWVRAYIEKARPELACGLDEQSLWLTCSGQGISPSILGNLVRGYVLKAEVGKQGSCHLFRHCMATSMLENGADLRYVQQMLGHAKLHTTEIYTHVAIAKLIEVHRLTHPAKMPEAAS